MLVALSLIGLTGCGGNKRTTSDVPGMEGYEDSAADLYVSMASAYYQRGQYDAALERGLRAVREDKRNADAHYVLAIIYQRLGKQVDSDRHFAEALRLAPNNPELVNARGTVLCSKGQYDEAIKLFRQAAGNQLYGTPEVPLMNASDCSRRAGRSVDAERFLREALTRNANYPPALLAMAQMSYTRGETKAARTYMQRYGRFGRATPDAMLLAYRIERKLGNKPTAKALADAMRKRYPDAPQVMEL
jgi:type IV pilus assembly protein PilF